LHPRKENDGCLWAWALFCIWCELSARTWLILFTGPAEWRVWCGATMSARTRSDPITGPAEICCGCGSENCARSVFIVEDVCWFSLELTQNSCTLAGSGAKLLIVADISFLRLCHDHNFWLRPHFYDKTQSLCASFFAWILHGWEHKIALKFTVLNDLVLFFMRLNPTDRHTTGLRPYQTWIVSARAGFRALSYRTDIIQTILCLTVHMVW
jgi:hypothetical protein